MFGVASYFPTLGCLEYSTELMKDQLLYLPNKLNMDSSFLFDFSASSFSQSQNYHEQELCYDHVINKQSDESPQGTSSTDHFDDPALVKKLNHNASERLRRKKISNLYLSLRDLLPPSDQKKKLSIPGTVVRMVEYIPELQQELENLIRKKKELVAKLSSLHGNASSEFNLEKKQKEARRINETTSCSIFANKLDEKELLIQISTIERISLSEVILVLEKDGYFVIDVSSFQSFGGRTFYNLHLWMEGSWTLNLTENLKETLLSVIEDQKQMLHRVLSVDEEQPKPMPFGPLNF